VACKVAERFVVAAKSALPLDGAEVARQLVASDLALLDTLEADADHAETHIARLLPATPFEILLTTPAWSTVRVGRHAAAVGEPCRWPTARQVYRASGLTPSTYESAGTRYDGKICREGSVELRGALLELGMGLWLCEQTGRARAAALRARGKPAGIIACAMANRANKIAFAMVRGSDPIPARPLEELTDLHNPPRTCQTRRRRPDQTLRSASRRRGCGGSRRALLGFAVQHAFDLLGCPAVLLVGLVYRDQDDARRLWEGSKRLRTACEASLSRRAVRRIGDHT